MGPLWAFVYISCLAGRLGCGPKSHQLEIKPDLSSGVQWQPTQHWPHPHQTKALELFHQTRINLVEGCVPSTRQRGHASANQPTMNHWIWPNYQITLSKHKIVRKTRCCWEKTWCLDIQVCKTQCFQEGMKILQVLEAHGISSLKKDISQYLYKYLWISMNCCHWWGTISVMSAPPSRENFLLR